MNPFARVARLFGVALRLFLRELRFVGFLANAFELALQTRIGFAANTFDFGIERRGRRLLRGFSCQTRFRVAGLLGLEVRLLLRQTGSFGFLTQALDLGLHSGLGLFARACDFRCDRARRCFVGDALGFLGSFLFVRAA